MPKTAKASTSKAAAKKPAGGKKKANGYQMPEKIPIGEVLTDLAKQKWRVATSIGSGGFGDIYCASNVDGSRKSDDNPFVVKVVCIELLMHRYCTMTHFDYFPGTTWKWTVVC